MLKKFEKENILSNFPNIKLSYEKIIYKKVYNSDFLIAIPKGKKCFAWFTRWNEKNICFIMELTSNKQINDIKIVNACFSNEIAYGTIIYGTSLLQSKNSFFYIEDIFLYKGIVVDRECWGEKLIKINKLLKFDLKQIAFNNSFIIFGLPYIYSNKDEFNNKIKDINYTIHAIQFKFFNYINNFFTMNYEIYLKDDKINLKDDKINLKDDKINLKDDKREIKNKVPNNVEIFYKDKKSYNYKKKEIIFLIKPDIQVDIYNLYCINELQKEIFHSIAHIPDYNTSVLMNKLFRNIKENDNLDALEESDDEEEFENENINKFVYLDKSYKMICKYNHKFKKWTPYQLCNEEISIVNINELKEIYQFYEKNKYNKNNYNKK